MTPLPTINSYTTQDQHFTIQMFNLWMNLEKLCPNLCFAVESKTGNSHKKWWSHFKHNINDWDISFPKILKIFQWFGENIFCWRKWNEPIRNSTHTTKYLAKRAWNIWPENSISEWTLETKALILSLMFTIIFHFLRTLLIPLSFSSGLCW